MVWRSLGEPFLLLIVNSDHGGQAPSHQLLWAGKLYEDDSTKKTGFAEGSCNPPQWRNLLLAEP